MKVEVARRNDVEKPVVVILTSESDTPLFGKTQFYLTKDEAMTLARALSIVSLDIVIDQMSAKR